MPVYVDGQLAVGLGGGTLDVQHQFRASGIISPAALGAGDTNDWAPTGLAAASRIRMSGNATPSVITGITGGVEGRILVLVNVGANTMTLAHGRTSIAANQFALKSGADISVPAGGSVVVQYDATSSRWRAIASL